MAISAFPISAQAAGEVQPDKAPQLNRDTHMQYMNGYTDGTFRPDASITRAEACKLLASLLVEKVQGNDMKFIDVAADAWYAEAVDQMTGFGLIKGYKDGSFRPSAKITRAEFVSILARFPHTDLGTDQSFVDVPADHWANEAVQIALAQGWVKGDGGNFRPNDPITRAETVTMVNRVLSRSADKAIVGSADGIRIMPDVPKNHWAYLAMLEATTDHKHEMKNDVEHWTGFDREESGLAEGWHNINGLLFHVNAEKQFDANKVVDNLQLDENGRYTTGSAELDQLLTAAVRGVVNEKMTQQEKLRAVYDYAKKTFGYLGLGEVDTTKPGWETEQAINMLKTKKGNCYSWASAFTYLARQVGFDAKAIPGKGVSPKGNESVHAWTEITIDGVAYTFDPQIESIYASRYGENYDLFMKKYGEAEWGYKKNETETPETPTKPETDAALSELMVKIYGDKKYQGMIQETVLANGMGADGTTQGLKWFLGTEDIKIESGLASESAITSQAHSVVLIRLPEGADVEAAKATLAKSVDSFKWVCVGVSKEKVKIDSVGNLICIVMDEENGETYINNFKANAKA